MKTVALYFENRSKLGGYMVNVDGGLPIPAVGDVIVNPTDRQKSVVLEREFSWKDSVPIIRYLFE
jgi:hypothetical protein